MGVKDVAPSISWFGTSIHVCSLILVQDQNSDTRKELQSQTADCCPPTNKLIEFIAGQLDARTMVQLESHFRECPSCAELLVATGDSADDDSFEQRLREAASNSDLALHRLPHHATAGEEASSYSTGYRMADDGLPEPAAAREIRQEFAGGERYELQEFLGGGGMGLVFAANHRVMGRRVAVKAIAPVLIGRQDVAARFEREVRALAALRHPNLVLAYDADAVGAIHFLVMELLEGEDLKRHVDQQGPLPFGAACRIMGTAARALGAAHERGIIHRDVKPRNLFLTKESQLKVLDFGLASLRILEPERSVWATQSGVLLGTLETMAPEQLDEPASVDARADVFGLGCTLYFAMTGRSPFQRRSRRETLQALLNGDVASPARLDGGIPGPLANYVLRMLAPDAADRPSTMEEVAEGLGTWLDARDNSVARGDLTRAAAEGEVAQGSEHVRRPDIRSRYLEGKPITTRRAGPVARGLKSAKRNRALAATTLALLLAVGGLCGAVFTWSGSGISPLVAHLGIIAMSISANDHVTTWYANGTVTKGTSWQLDAKWEPRPYSMPPGK